MSPGYVYVLDNVSMPGLLKIGGTERTPEDRARELSISTGVPTPFVTRFSARVIDWRQAEAAIHRRLDQHRPNKSREFFRINDKQAIDLVYQIAEQYKPTSPKAEQGQLVSLKDDGVNAPNAGHLFIRCLIYTVKNIMIICIKFGCLYPFLFSRI